MEYLRGALQLRASAFAEWDPDLAAAVARVWGHAVEQGAVVGHERIASDVWDLLRGRPTPIDVFVEALPAGMLVFNNCRHSVPRHYIRGAT